METTTRFESVAAGAPVVNNSRVETSLGRPITPTALGVAPMPDTQAILDELLWVVLNSEGVIGLKLDGKVMPWPEVCKLYAHGLADYLDPTARNDGADDDR